METAFVVFELKWTKVILFQQKIQSENDTRTIACVNGCTGSPENTVCVVRRVIDQIDKDHFNLTTNNGR